MARPKKEKREILSEQILIRFNKNQIEEIKKYVRDNIGESKDISSFLRDIILKTIRDEKIQFVKMYSPEYLFELNKIGINLNQLARKVNSYVEFREYDFPKLEELINKITNIITEQK